MNPVVICGTGAVCQLSGEIACEVEAPCTVEDGEADPFPEYFEVEIDL